MSVQSTPFGPVVISGEDAKVFEHKVRLGRGASSAVVAATSGRILVANFRAAGAVTIDLKPKKRS